MAYNIKGFIPCKVLYYLMNSNMNFKPIYLTRCGEKIKPQDKTEIEHFGADFDLAEKGLKYTEQLYNFFLKESKKPEFSKGWKLLYSSRKAAKTTIEKLETLPGVISSSMKCLDELNYGVAEGWTVDDLKLKMPDVYKGHIEQSLDFKYRKKNILDNDLICTLRENPIKI